MSMRLLRERLHKLPMPLAQLVQRAVNSKSAVERHHNAYYLAECALKLASAARIGVWLERALAPDSALARRIECLALPSTGHWCELLRETSLDLSKRVDVDLLPTVPNEALVARQDWRSVRDFADACVKHELFAKETAKAALKRGVMGVFDLCVPYRNEVIGHGAQRTSSFYEEFASLLFAMLEDVLACPALLGDGVRLAVAHRELSADTRESYLRWHFLEGLASLASDEPAGKVEAGHLYLVHPRGAIALHPLVVYESGEEMARERVGFLNRTSRRSRNAASDDAQDVRRVDYLDYATGQSLGGVDTRVEVSALLSRLKGRAVTTADLERAMQEADEEAAVSVAPPARGKQEMIGSYVLLSELGRGAMGIVYKAQESILGRTVALKVLPPALASDETARKRFEREVRALARCDHPNVVKILSSAEEDGRLYYAMEYVDGNDLGHAATVMSRWRSTGERLDERHLAAAVTAKGDAELAVIPKERNPAPPRPLGVRLAELFADAADGLAHLHANEILHRDIKPANLMLTGDGRRIVIMDLGLARMANESRALTSADVNILGTLRYMAPEQLQRRLVDLDARADVYGLGASLYEVATGRPPFDGETEQRLIHQVLHDLPVPPRKVDSSISPDLAVVIEIAMSKLREDRYSSALALAADLRAVAKDRPILARRPSLQRRALLWARRHRALVGALAIAVPAVLAMVWMFVVGGTKAAFVVERFDDDVDVRKWKPYDKDSARTSPVDRHIRLGVRRQSSASSPFIEWASTTSQQGLDCVVRTVGGTCVEEPSAEPPRRTWLVSLPAESFRKGNVTGVDYDVTYWNSFPFHLGDGCASCDITKQFVYPVDEYRLTIHFPPERTWKRVDFAVRKDGEGTTRLPEKISNESHLDVFTHVERHITAGTRFAFHVRLE